MGIKISVNDDNQAMSWLHCWITSNSDWYFCFTSANDKNQSSIGMDGGIGIMVRISKTIRATQIKSEWMASLNSWYEVHKIISK